MQHLNRGMLGRYDIPEHIPETVSAVQFGLGERLLGVVDRLIDDAGLGIGIACVPEAETPQAALLRDQQGLYTTFVRGYRGEALVNREQVVETIVEVTEPGAIDALAASPDLALGIVDADEAGPALYAAAARLLDARRRAGLSGLSFICVGDTADSGERVRRGIARAYADVDIEQAADGGAAAPPDSDFAAWLERANAFCPALADGLAFRAEAREAAKLCADMNYADGMIHTAEPYARLIVQAPADFRERWPLDGADGASFTDDLSEALAWKRRLYDAGLFALAAPGWLLGCETLHDCMKLERLRAFAGRAYLDELMRDMPREAAAPRVIEAFERFENPLSNSPVLKAARPLLRRFRLGALPVIRDIAARDFEPPRRLAFALAATIMLYAGARRNPETSAFEVLRGSRAYALDDAPEALAVFATLSHDMPPETLAYAALADRELWGCDLREIDGLEARVALDIAAIQRNPAYLPEEEL